jgi:hypothetical protein
MSVRENDVVMGLDLRPNRDLSAAFTRAEAPGIGRILSRARTVRTS